MDLRELNETWKTNVSSSDNRILCWLKLVDCHIKDRVAYSTLRSIVLDNCQTRCTNDYQIKTSTEVLQAAHKSVIDFDPN